MIATKVLFNLFISTRCEIELQKEFLFSIIKYAYMILEKMETDQTCRQVIFFFI